MTSLVNDLHINFAAARLVVLVSLWFWLATGLHFPENHRGGLGCAPRSLL